MNNVITFVSYNIWFDTTLCIERLISLIEILLILDPDVICLQEVRPEIYNFLIGHLNNYRYRFPKKINKSYGCVTFSRYPITKCLDYEFTNSDMGRSLIVTKIEYPYKNTEDDKNEITIDKIDIVVANSHFESIFKKNIVNDTKLKQYELSAILLNKLYGTFKNIILCTDTNLMDHEEEYFDKIFDETSWKDLWKMKGSNLNKYTYDSYENVHLATKLPKFKYKSRIDRIIYKTKNCYAEEFNILKADIGCIEPSDHFGVYGKFIIEKS